MIIDADGDTVEFKSDPFFFARERDGLKNNTVRYFKNSYEENRFRSSLFGLSWVRIRNMETGDTFERIITDISTLPDCVPTVYIISWEARHG